ncbi:MAG: FliM/FliN family flagellar motor switch protein, partial [Phycisphaerae bacterium]
MSDDKPTNEGTPEDSGDFAGFSQDEIDALFGQDAGGDEAQSVPPAGDPSGVDPATSPSTSQPAADGNQAEFVGSDGVSQADIDALFGESSSEAGDPPNAPAPAQDDRVDTLGRPFDEVAAAMQAAMEEEAAQVTSPPSAPSDGAPVAGNAGAGAPPMPDAQPFQLNEFGDAGGGSVAQQRVTMLGDVKLRVKIELGRTRMRVEDVLTLGEGSVVELD